MLDTSLLLWLDLCCGLGGASMPAKRRGWRTIGIDNNPALLPSIVGDIRALPVQTALPVTVLWASPPCTEYSKSNQLGIFPEWRGREPDRTLWLAVYRAIAEIKPRFWVIENVKGAQKWWGPSSTHFGAVYLWTNLDINGYTIPSYKENMSSRRAQVRAMTPYVVGDEVCKHVEALLAQEKDL